MLYGPRGCGKTTLFRVLTESSISARLEGLRFVFIEHDEDRDAVNIVSNEKTLRVIERGSGFIAVDIKKYQPLFPWLHRPQNPFHWGPYHWPPPVQGDPDPQLLFIDFLGFIAVGKPHILGFFLYPAHLGLYLYPHCWAGIPIE